MGVFLGATQDAVRVVESGQDIPGWWWAWCEDADRNGVIGTGSTLREAAEDARDTLAHRRREREFIRQTGCDLFGCTRGR